MDNEHMVVNTGPLILLGKIGALDIAGQLPVSFISPPAVCAELASGVGLGYLKIDPPWLEIRKLRSPVSPIAEASLDRGEAEVIQLALDYGIRDVCLDDLRGRKMAKVVGLNVTGLLGLLARAKLIGIIPLLKPFTDRLMEVGGRYSPGLIQNFLLKYGE
jgi:predicted nucleic acid-binding protein